MPHMHLTRFPYQSEIAVLWLQKINTRRDLREERHMQINQIKMGLWVESDNFEMSTLISS